MPPSDVKRVRSREYVLYFAAFYISLLLVSAAAIYLLELDSGIALNAASLTAAAVATSSLFAKREGRFFRKSELRRIVSGSFVVDALVQVSTIALLSPDFINDAQAIGLIALVLLIHLVGLAFVYGVVAKRLFVRQKSTQY